MSPNSCPFWSIRLTCLRRRLRPTFLKRDVMRRDTAVLCRLSKLPEADPLDRVALVSPRVPHDGASPSPVPLIGSSFLLLLSMNLYIHSRLLFMAFDSGQAAYPHRATDWDTARTEMRKTRSLKAN